MATTTARPDRAALRRTLTVDTIDSSRTSTATNSTIASPISSPANSASVTSLSSLASDDGLLVDKIDPKPYGTMLDTYGNEFELPDYTMKQIRDAVPAHCFERSGARGLSYVARDIFSLATTFYLFHTFVRPEYVPSTPVRAGLWALYTIIQGLFGTGLWVMAHECGHQSFSPSKTLNDTVGFICHSALLVPYFSWKISHGKHHKATGHLERDMVFVPKNREQYASKLGYLAHEVSELMEETPILTMSSLLGQQLFGWPMYLFSNITGHDCHEKQTEGKGAGKRNGWFSGINHFNPASPLYEKKDEHLILASDAGLAIVASILYYIGSTFGWTNLLVWYGIPYLWVNHWLVAITYLQHTDPSLPHYEPEMWNFTRGAAATIDREFGFIGRHLLHGIIETHVLHHYISTIPFYHADEATEAIKPIMGKHYRSDVKDGPRGFISALFRSPRWCNWVEPSSDAKGEGMGVLFYRNRNGLGTKPAQMAAPRK